jgi:predicted ferric reductase
MPANPHSHVEIFNGEYDMFFWPCALIWVADRFLRTARILLFNFRFWKMSGTVAYNSKSNIMRVAVDSKSSMLRPYPGCYYYIYTLNHLLFWESHPFTLAYSTIEDGTAQLSTKDDGGLEGFENNENVDHSHRSSESDQLLSRRIHSSSLVFLIRPYDGFTSRLKNYAQEGPQPLRILLEGPYGELDNFHHFQNILFIVGGSGIAVPLCFLKTLARADGGMPSISIVWAVREPQFFTETLNKDFKLALPETGKKVVLSIYCTHEARSLQSEWSHCQSAQDIDVQLFYGRPDIQEEIEKLSLASRNEGENLAVVACGPGSMSDDARAAVVGMVKKGHADIEFFDKGFTW